MINLELFEIFKCGNFNTDQVESSRSKEPGGQICIYNNFRVYLRETKHAVGLRVYFESDIKSIEAQWKINVTEKWTRKNLLDREYKFTFKPKDDDRSDDWGTIFTGAPNNKTDFFIVELTFSKWIVTWKN